MYMKYLSPSRLSLFAQCPLSFKFKYIETSTWEDETTDYYAAYGSLFHEIAEKLAKDEIALWEAKNLYNEGFPLCYIPEKQRANYYPQGLSGIQAVAEELEALKPNILGVEKEFTFMMDFSIPPLHGFIDLVYEDECGLVIRDYKTSRVYTKTIMDNQLQPYIYSLACKELYGRYPYKFEFHFVRFNEKKSFLINDSFLKFGEIKVRNYWNEIQNSDFPARYNPFFCENFCFSKSLCPIYQIKVNK